MASVLEELEGLFPAAAAETVYEIRLDLISPDPSQPRKDFDPAELDDLALSIESNGVLSPILLRPDAGNPGRYLIVTGERRYRASERARRTSIPALIREVEPGLLLILQLVENVQRSELRPLETAQALNALLASTPGLTKARVAALLGKSQAWVSQHLALLGYEGATHTALAEDLLQSPETARLFEKLPEQDRTELLEQARTAGAPITRNAVTAVQTAAPPPPSPAKKTGRPAKERMVSLPPVTAAQLAVLFTALGLGPVPPSRDEIWTALLSRLTT
jgi:ParB family transcriptional regulator, chromosome partitioning protein